MCDDRMVAWLGRSTVMPCEVGVMFVSGIVVWTMVLCWCSKKCAVAPVSATTGECVCGLFLAITLFIQCAFNFVGVWLRVITLDTGDINSVTGKCVFSLSFMFDASCGQSRFSHTSLLPLSLLLRVALS